MTFASYLLKSGVRYALIGMTLLFGFECSSFAGSSFTPPLMNDASCTYPAARSDCRCPNTFFATGHFERVLVIVLENSDYKEAIADGYLRRLMKKGAYFSNFHGLFHPSYSNYLAMVTGQEIVTDHDQQVDLQNVCSIADLLAAKGLDWKNYAQGYPETVELYAYPNRCVTENQIGNYVRKHVPFMSFVSIQNDEEKCSRIVAANRFDLDLKGKTFPAYAFYSPDLENDGHDTNVTVASKWLKGFLDPLLDDDAFMKKTLVIVTFDESKNNADNRIYTVFLGGMVRPDTEVRGYYTHFNVLRTIEENFGLCPLGEGDGGAKPILEVWK